MAEMDLGIVSGANFPLLDAELKAALPGQVNGIAWDSRNHLRVIPNGGIDVEAIRQPVLAVIAAHNPAVMTAEQQEAAARETVKTTLAAADFTAWVTNVKNATTLAALKPLLLQLGRVVWMLAKAQGLTTAADPGE